MMAWITLNIHSYFKLSKAMAPSSLLNYLNYNLLMALVRISTTCSYVGQYITSSFPLVTLLPCETRFLARLINDLLFIFNLIVSSDLIIKSFEND